MKNDVSVGYVVFTALAWAVLAGGIGCDKSDPPSTQAGLQTDEYGFLPPVSPSELKATQMSPFANVPVGAGSTVVYCPTYALAWKSFFGNVAGNEFQQSVIDDPFSKDDISADDLRIVPCATSDDVRAARLELDIFANGSFEPEAGNTYCALRKSLPFNYEFERLEQPLQFRSGRNSSGVHAFGVTSDWDYWSLALMRVRVVDFRSPDDFVIRIENREREELILAMIPEPKTLELGIADVNRRIDESDIEFEASYVVNDEPLVIPVIELSLLEKFDEGSQLIQFRLDEKGAMLVSESDVGMKGGFEPGSRSFVFDQPFLIILKESSDKNPYLAAWIGNDDLMIKHQ